MSEDTGSKRMDERTKSLPVRFYKSVAVEAQSDGHVVLLDGRAVNTPLRQKLVLPTLALAEAIAGEWDEQDEQIDPMEMPITKLANTSVDHADSKFQAILDEFVSYAGADMLCYRADTPTGLVERQAANWDPLLTWAARDIGAAFVVTVGIMHQEQPGPALEACRKKAATYDPFRITALQTLTALTGSAVLSLAMLEREVDADAAWRAANVDEDWQIELWGRDEEAERQRASRYREFEAADRFIGFL